MRQNKKIYYILNIFQQPPLYRKNFVFLQPNLKEALQIDL